MDNEPLSFTSVGRQALLVLETLITQREVERDKRNEQREHKRRDEQPAEQHAEKVDCDLCHVNSP
jgi:hypothetical protein